MVYISISQKSAVEESVPLYIAYSLSSASWAGGRSRNL